MLCFKDVLLLTMFVLGCIQESRGLSTDPVGPYHLKTYYGATPNPGQVTSRHSNYHDVFNDEGWPQQWIAHDYRTSEGPVMDHNLVPVYRMGITGKGVKIGVVDLGFQQNHPDLDNNYIREMFVDLKDRWDFPFPSRKEPYPDHGMHSLGLIAMVENNSQCGVGVAFGAKVAGIKLDLIANNKGESLGEAVSYGIDHFDIYSNSWTSSDKIGVMSQKLPLLEDALRMGVTKGRAGKGAIYVFNAGNGKSEQANNCGTDPIVNMVHTIPIAAATSRGKITTYSERCAAVFATAYSGDFKTELLYTTGLDGSCAKSYSGTSAAVPIASGIIALTLQANPELTYRDVQHLIAMSSEVAPLADNPNTWYKNKAGFWVSNDFGFGLLNAKNMVKLAKSWKRVPEQTVCTVTYRGSFRLFDSGSKLKYTINTEACQKKLKKEHKPVNYLEQVEITVSLHYIYRGALSFRLMSPAGTESIILEPRMHDLFRDGLSKLKLRSLHTWGENPAGKWTFFLDVKDWLRYEPSKLLDFVSKIKNEPLHFGLGSSGRLEHLSIKLYGTETQPEHLKSPRTYSAFRLDDGRTNES